MIFTVEQDQRQNQKKIKSKNSFVNNSYSSSSDGGGGGGFFGINNESGSSLKTLTNKVNSENKISKRQSDDRSGGGGGGGDGDEGGGSDENDEDNCRVKQRTHRPDKGIFSKCSTRCLIVFAIGAIVIIVFCSVFMVIVTTNFLIKTTAKLNEDNTNRDIGSDKYSDNNSHLAGLNTRKKSSNNGNNKERNALTWLRDAIKKSFADYNGETNEIENKKVNDYDFNNPQSNIEECGNPSIPPHLISTRIMNGKEALPNSWPYIISIALDGPRDYVPHACGGTLINKRYVITAAHCVLNTSVFSLVGSPIKHIQKFSTVESMMRIFAGVHDRSKDITPQNIYRVERIITHHGFDSVTFKNDVALIRLDRDVERSPKVGFVCLTKSSQVVPGDTVYAIGWGYTDLSRNQASRYLMQVDLTVQTRDNCLIQYIDRDQFCAGNTIKHKDTCNGDSGGPILRLINNKWNLMGIVSNGDVSCSGTGIYINVPYFYDWISRNSLTL